MEKQERIELKSTKLLGLKHLVGVKGEKTLIRQSMIGYKGAIGYKGLPPV